MIGASLDNGDDLRRFFSGCETAPQQPWPRYRLGETQWLDLATHLTIVDWALLGLWGDREEVHAALIDAASGEIAVASLGCSERRFPSLASVRPGALRLERAVRDLFGLAAESDDARPWLDHGARCADLHRQRERALGVVRDDLRELLAAVADAALELARERFV
jgi:hypothetical protein